jgi:hypothetical protein
MSIQKKKPNFRNGLQIIPYDAELSHVPGASVSQVKLNTSEDHMISSNSPEWKSAKAEHPYLGNIIR